MASKQQDDSQWKVILEIGLDDDAATKKAMDIRAIDLRVTIGVGVISNISSEASADQIVALINGESAKLEQEARSRTDNP